MKHSARLVLALSLGTCSAATAQQPAPGRLVIVGGGLDRDNESVYRAVVEGRSGVGPLCVVPTASGGDPAQTIAGAVASFERWSGAGTVRGITIATTNPAAATDTSIVRAIGECSGFWFTGGVQSRISTVFRPRGGSSPAYEALLARHRAGAVVGGSSAGAAIMSDPMIAAGNTRGALTHGVARIPAEADEDDDADPVNGVAIAAGLGFLEDAIVDQHFLARGRIGRLITAVLELDEYDLGFGIDENTALVVDGSVAHVAGESGVVVIDAHDAVRDGTSTLGVKLHLLGPGDRFDLEERTVRQAASKSALAAAQSSVAVPENVFARWEFLHLLHRFATSSQIQIPITLESGQLVLRKGPDFAARAADGAGVQDTPAGLSITGIVVDLLRPTPIH